MRRRKRGWARPGDRRKRWNQSHSISAMIFVFFGVMALTSIDGDARFYLAAFFFGMAALDMRDVQRGWPLKGGIPPHARHRDDPVHRAVVAQGKREGWIGEDE